MTSYYGDITAIWHRAFWTVRIFVGHYLPDDQCHDAAAKTCALWFQAAADGTQTTDGAFYALFAAAEHVVNERDPMTLTGATRDFTGAIPLHDLRLSCDLSRLYSAIWQVGQLCEWDRKTIHRLSKRISRMWPRSEECWAHMDAPPIDDPDARLARRAFALMHDHSCVDNPICDRAAVIWEQEEQRSSDWIRDERLAREGI